MCEIIRNVFSISSHLTSEIFKLFYILFYYIFLTMILIKTFFSFWRAHFAVWLATDAIRVLTARVYTFSVWLVLQNRFFATESQKFTNSEWEWKYFARLLLRESSDSQKLLCWVDYRLSVSRTIRLDRVWSWSWSWLVTHMSIPLDHFLLSIFFPFSLSFLSF